MNDNVYLRQLMTLPIVVEAKLSPDKCWVAFRWYRMNENFDVFFDANGWLTGTHCPYPHPGSDRAGELDA